MCPFYALRYGVYNNLMKSHFIHDCNRNCTFWIKIRADLVKLLLMGIISALSGLVSYSWEAFSEGNYYVILINKVHFLAITVQIEAVVCSSGLLHVISCLIAANSNKWLLELGELKKIIGYIACFHSFFVQRLLSTFLFYIKHHNYFYCNRDCWCPIQ